MFRVATSALLIAQSLAAPPDHPTLPTMWVSTTSDPPQGVGVESYYFVDTPTDDNPSAMWSNYTNPECKRLIYDPGYTQTRYLLKCDAVDCCHEDGEGNQVEFQIPNVHPPQLATNFTVAIQQKVVTEFGSVVCDVYSWNFAKEHWDVCVNKCPECVNQVTLLQWHIKAFTTEVQIDFKDFKGIAEADRPTFKANFQIPDVCKGNILKCDSYRKEGKLRPRQLTPAERLHQWREEVYAKNGLTAPPLRTVV